MARFSALALLLLCVVACSAELEIAWQFSLPQYLTQVNVFAGDPDQTTLYVGSHQSVFALNTADGSQRWQFDLPSPYGLEKDAGQFSFVSVPPQVLLVFVARNTSLPKSVTGSALFVLDRQTGALHWSRQWTPEKDGHWPDHSLIPAVSSSGGVVYLASTYLVTALDVQQRVNLWRTDMGNLTSGRMCASPIYDPVRHLVYVAYKEPLANDASLFALQHTDGRVVFTGHTASPASAGGQLALSRAGDVVLATGTAMQAMNISSVLQPVAWTAQLQSTVQAFAIDTAANTAFVWNQPDPSSLTHSIAAVDLGSGSLLRDSAVAAAIYVPAGSQLTVNAPDGIVYAGFLPNLPAPECTVVAISTAADGKELWRQVLAETCRLQPQLAPFWSSTQQLLYASTLRTVWALRPPGSDSKPPLSRPWIVALSVGGGVLIACAALAFWQWRFNRPRRGSIDSGRYKAYEVVAGSSDKLYQDGSAAAGPGSGQQPPRRKPSSAQRVAGAGAGVGAAGAGAGGIPRVGSLNSEGSIESWDDTSDGDGFDSQIDAGSAAGSLGREDSELSTSVASEFSAGSLDGPTMVPGAGAGQAGKGKGQLQGKTNWVDYSSMDDRSRRP